jgi:uncharacterized protein YceK
MKSFYIVMTSLALGGCAQVPLIPPPTPSDYERTLYHARQNVDAGNYWAAERILDEFVRTHPDTREAKEVVFWKAAYMVDPANERGSLAGGIAALDGYLADSTGLYRNEARLLRRTAAAAAAAQGASVGTTASAPTPSTPGTTDTVVVVSRSRDEEIAALKDQLAKSKEELAKVSAELDRIKKRLANPSN